MAKKQFIRHLEFYGFPDQNKYAGFGDIDLSDIREKNREQDEEIQDLEGEKAEKKDLDELSGTVENLIAAQSEVNEAFAEAISGMSVDIEELEETYNEFAEQISALTDAVDDIADNLEDLSASTNFNIAELRQGFNAYTRYADMEFAHRNNVYTKAEIDDMFSGASGFATVEWVEEQGFLTEESGDTLYVRKDGFDIYSGEVESAITDLTDAIVAVDEKVDEKIEVLDGKVDELSGYTNFKIAETNERLSAYARYADNEFAHKNEFNNIVSGINEDIAYISGRVDTNTADISGCTIDIQNLSRTKADRSELDHAVMELQSQISTKAEKTDLNTLSATVIDLSSELANEVTRSTDKDNELDGRVTVAERKADSALTIANSFETRVHNVETGLTKEIADREQEDEDLKVELIGVEGDYDTADTIWGAKAYAKEMKRQAISSAMTYVDDKYTEFNTALLNMSATTDQKLTAKADINDVSGMCLDVETRMKDYTDNAVSLERKRRIAADDALGVRIDNLDESFISATTAISLNSTILHALTEWDGEGEYTDVGNGIVDVMHRELHNLIDTLTQKGILP